MRVVSLLPAATEILHALEVVPAGVSHECDHPPAARELPTVTSSRIDPDATTDEINEQVAQAAASGGVYGLDRERLSRIDPDLIVTQGICDVCAVDGVRVATVADELDLGAEIVTIDIHSLADLYDAIERLATATGRIEHARELIGRLRARVEIHKERAGRITGHETRAGREEGVEEIVGQATPRPRVAVLDWTDPIMVAGHWIPELVDIAGGRYDLASPGSHSRPREWDEIREYDPEILVVAPCGFDLAQARANRSDLTDRPGWSDLSAVQTDEVWIVDGSHLVNRPGPRLVDTLEALAGIVHPEEFDRPPDALVRRF